LAPRGPGKPMIPESNRNRERRGGRKEGEGKDKEGIERMI